MDFKSLISKLDSMDAPPQTPAAPELPKAVQLDEDVALHVLAGTKTLTEAADLMEKKLTKAEKEKKEEVVKSMKKDKAGFEKRYGKRGEEVMHATATKIAKKKAESVESEEEALAEEEMKVGDTKKSSTGGTLTKTKTGVKHKAKEWDGEDHAEPAQSKASKASMSGEERRAQKSVDAEQEKVSAEWERRFGKGSVTRVKDGKKVESVETSFRSKFAKMVEEAKKADKKVKGKKAEEKMDEAKGSKPDFLDVDKDGNKKEPMKKAAKEAGKGKKKDDKKDMSAKQAKYFGKKKSVKESIFENFEDKADELMDWHDKFRRYRGRNGDPLSLGMLRSMFDTGILSDGWEENEYLKAAKRLGKEEEDWDDNDYERAVETMMPITKSMKEELEEILGVPVGEDEAAEVYEIITSQEESQVDEYFYFDEPGSKKKDRGPRDTGRDELARRQKYGIKATDPDYKQKDDPRYRGQYKISGPKGRLPESQRRSKKVVAESFEMPLTFKDMVKLVHESGGQQQIDALDKELFAWATRMAKAKLGEGMKAEVYAGLVYERMGGRFEMYDVLSEDQK